MDFNFTNIYIKINDKLNSIQHILLSTLDTATGTYPVGSVMVFEMVEIARLYTNTELPEDVVEAYDMLIENGFDIALKSCAASLDISRYRAILSEQIKKLERYQTSAYGILDSIKHDYDNLNLEAEEIQKKLNSGEGLETVKAVIEKLG